MVIVKTIFLIIALVVIADGSYRAVREIVTGKKYS